MLPVRCFEEPWLKAKKQELGVQDLELLERTVHAFALLHGLLDEGLNFVFKGGTCMLLLPTGFQRLSLDVDIQTTVLKADLERILGRVGARLPFTRWQRKEREHMDPPQRSHYEFFYPARTVEGERKILLDVVEDACPLTDLNRLPAAPVFMELGTAPDATLPTLDALLGDKLTAFAPGTIGVPLSKNLQVVKQLHDIRQLARHAAQPEVFRRAYRQACAAQIRYSGRTWSLKEVAADTVRHAWHGRVATFGGEAPTPLIKDLLAGKSSLGNYLLSARSYQDVEYQTALATAAALAVWAVDDREESGPWPIGLSEEENTRLSRTDSLAGPENFRKLFKDANRLWVWTWEHTKRPAP